MVLVRSNAKRELWVNSVISAPMLSNVVTLMERLHLPSTQRINCRFVSDTQIPLTLKFPSHLILNAVGKLQVLIVVVPVLS